jgi:hypothetical protein
MWLLSVWTNNMEVRYKVRAVMDHAWVFSNTANT